MGTDLFAGPSQWSFNVTVPPQMDLSLFAWTGGVVRKEDRLRTDPFTGERVRAAKPVGPVRRDSPSLFVGPKWGIATMHTFARGLTYSHRCPDPRRS